MPAVAFCAEGFDEIEDVVGAFFAQVDDDGPADAARRFRTGLTTVQSEPDQLTGLRLVVEHQPGHMYAVAHSPKPTIAATVVAIGGARSRELTSIATAIRQRPIKTARFARRFRRRISTASCIHRRYALFVLISGRWTRSSHSPRH